MMKWLDFFYEYKTQLYFYAFSTKHYFENGHGGLTSTFPFVYGSVESNIFHNETPDLTFASYSNRYFPLFMSFIDK